MSLPAQIAKHFREVHFGGNWTVSSLKGQLEGVTWLQATTKVNDLNTIAALVFHINYFTEVILKVLQGGPLEGNDKFSFDVPEIANEEQWQQLVSKALNDAALCTTLIEQLPESQFWETFMDEKYGNYYRNIHGIIEHTHYHLGQIAVVKRWIQERKG